MIGKELTIGRFCFASARGVSVAVAYSAKLWIYFFCASVPAVVVGHLWLNGVALPLVIALTLLHSYAVIRFGR